ncbi:MAG: histidine phosphatase family protein [Flavobacteriales bacterium]|nr:histidine phosphatase family protein [Flavobacteriales bacterium]MBL6873677.1 histidine phosphatase family protein [Flavobacteriales bacterium]
MTYISRLNLSSLNPLNKTFRRVLIFCLLTQVWNFDVFAQSDDVFTIYLVRHSEKDHTSDKTSDLPLSKCGEQRAMSLSNFLDEVNLDKVYSTDFTRTRNTALPTADKKEIDITLYDEQNIQSFSNHLIENKQDVLVVGHSNTTVVLAGLLINKEIQDIELHIYDHIYQIVVSGDSRTLNLFHSTFKCIE